MSLCRGRIRIPERGKGVTPCVLYSRVIHLQGETHTQLECSTIVKSQKALSSSFILYLNYFILHYWYPSVNTIYAENIRSYSVKGR
jgi:hypothetical protein